MSADSLKEKRSLSVNTSIQKKNDENIQNLFLNNYKYYDENPQFKKITGKNYDLIISHKSTIPDLVIYNRVFNKNECFLEANRNENNYYPRKSFYIKFNEKEKYEYINKNENDKENQRTKINKVIENVHRDEDNEDDDENEEEEEDEEKDISFENIKENINNLNYDLRNSSQGSSYLDNNSIMSNNNSMLTEYEFLRKCAIKNNIRNSMNKPESSNQSRMNYFENSFNFEEPNNISYNSNIMNNINNLIDTKNDDASTILSNRNRINANINLQNININDFNINNEFFDSPNIQNILNYHNNKYLNMFTNQIIILKRIKLIQNYQNLLNQNIEKALKELKENILDMALFSKEGNILGSSSNCYEIFEYITENILPSKKNISELKIYIIDTNELIQGDSFYFSIINFLDEISKI